MRKLIARSIFIEKIRLEKYNKATLAVVNLQMIINPSFAGYAIEHLTLHLLTNWTEEVVRVGVSQNVIKVQRQH